MPISVNKYGGTPAKTFISPKSPLPSFAEGEPPSKVTLPPTKTTEFATVSATVIITGAVFV